MNTTEMEPLLASAVRRELSGIGSKRSRLQRQHRRNRAVQVGIAFVVVVGATTSAGVLVNHFRAAMPVVLLGAISASPHTGTALVNLGPAPASAEVVNLSITCLGRVGTVTVQTRPEYPDSGASSATIDCSLRSTPLHVRNGILPKPGTTTITIAADPGTRWTATANFASSTKLPRRVNARGHTYGECSSFTGCPDLVQAQATNGKIGYVALTEEIGLTGSGLINVYKSDGTTVIGKFPIGNYGNWSSDYTAATGATSGGN